MTIHSKQYQPYGGQVAVHGHQYLTIAGQEVRLAWSRRWVRRLLITSYLPLVVCLVILYVQLVIQKTFAMNLWGGEVFEMLYRAQIFFVVLLMAVGGADLISKDTAARAHTLYFARPLGTGQYVVGKVLSQAIILGLVSVVPGIVLDLGQLLMAWELDVPAFLAKLAQVTAYGALLATVGALIITCLSSFGTRARYVGLMWVALYFVSNILSAALREMSSSGEELNRYSLISIQTLFFESGRFFYAVDRPNAWPLLVTVALGLASAAILYRRIRALQRKES